MRGVQPRPDLRELAVVFLRLGVTAFGGPAAHVAFMENELVRRRGWLTHERFLDLLGASNLIPGPSSTELAIYIGFERAGPPGLLLAGACFILSAALMTGGIAAMYVRFGSVPQVEHTFTAVKPVVFAVVVQAISGLAPRAVKSAPLALIGIVAGVAAALGSSAVIVLIGAGALAGGRRPARVPIALPSLFLLFLKTGAVVFGSGYVLIVFLRDDLVERLHWLTDAQLMDSIAVGQITPGPVFTTATFIGYLLAGAPGAIVATFGIFLPGFLLVAATRPLLARLRRSPTAGAFLDGVNVASLALMAVVTLQLARGAMNDPLGVGTAFVGAVLLLRYKINTTWLIAGAILAGLLVTRR